MIYDKKSDILPRLCFGLIYPPKKAEAAGCRGFRFFVSVLDAYDELSIPRPPLGKGGDIKGIDTYAEHVCWRRRDRGRTLFAREES